MKSKHLLLSAIFAIALFWEISSGTVVKADSFNGASTNSQLTTSQIKQADKYVDVSNNSVCFIRFWEEQAFRKY